MRKQTIPLLSFDFLSSSGKVETLTFNNPKEVIIANSIDEVLPSLEKVEAAVEKGFYAAGFLTYESASAFDSSFKVKENYEMPLLWFGVFSEPLNMPLESEAKQFQPLQWTPTTSQEQYQKAIQTIKDYIAKGQTYQTNYTIRLHAHFEGDSVAYYKQLKKAQAANYSTYLDIGDFKILSVSPELFFHVKDGKIITRPMKGTMKRGTSYADDKNKAEELVFSEKNRAENIMIVDLLRNDIGTIAELGTVKVEELFTIESYPTVHQMTSTVTGKLRENVTLPDIFKGLFPCGSITGAPKIKTMDIIDELESDPREVYCGAIGYITPNKEAIFNVPIRTVIINDKTSQAIYGVGGGITWDSTAEDEYFEVVAKAKVLEEERPSFDLIESMLLSNGQYFLLEYHLKRLENSSKYFQFKMDKKSIEQQLLQFAKAHLEGDYKVRLLLQKTGGFTIEGQKISPFEEPLSVQLADEPVQSTNPFLYHKTTNRKIYTYFQKKFPEVFDVLLWNERGELTEFTNGNVVLEIENKYYTPPVQSGLLSGTYRESLLEEGTIQEKILTLDDLQKCDNIYFINSVRKWLKVKG